MLGNKQYCYPLTITDFCSRYLIACDGLDYTFDGAKGRGRGVIAIARRQVEPEKRRNA